MSGDAATPPPPDLPATAPRHERELAFWRREASELGARLLRAQEEQRHAVVEAQRSRLVARMVRELHRVAAIGGGPHDGGSDGGAPAAALAGRFVEAIAETTVCDRAALLREVRTGGGAFEVLAAVGLAEGSRLRLRRPPPAFLFTTGREPGGQPAAAVAAFLGVPYVLWAYEPEEGFALALGSRVEGNAARPFEAADQELVETALAVFFAAHDRVSRTAAAPGRPGPAADILDGGDGGGGGPGDAARPGLEGGEALQQQLRRGGAVAGFAVVERPGGDGPEYVAYLRVTWLPGWRVLRTFRDKDDRTYRDLGRLVQYARSELGFGGCIRVYRADAEDLAAALPGVAARERRTGPVRPDDGAPVRPPDGISA